MSAALEIENRPPGLTSRHESVGLALPGSVGLMVISRCEGNLLFLVTRIDCVAMENGKMILDSQSGKVNRPMRQELKYDERFPHPGSTSDFEFIYPLLLKVHGCEVFHR